MRPEPLVIVGVPKELKQDEHRVALTQAGARELVRAGHRVLVEAGAGDGSSIPDDAYRANGAAIVDDADDLWSESELVLKVKEPVPEEYARLGAHRGQVLFTYLHLAAARPCTDALRAAGNIAIAYETVRRPDGSLPLLTPMSEIAGRMAAIVGAHYLMRPNGRGALVSGVPGVVPSRVAVIGAGVAGLAAATMARGMAADVVVLDTNLDRLRYVDHHFAGTVRTIASSHHAIEEAITDADVVVGAVLVVGARAPTLVTNEDVARMRAGSVLVDISVDQGGCFEASRPTTHSDPVFEASGSVFYCVANMPGAVPATSTPALANATLPYALEIAGSGWRAAATADPALADGVNVVEGAVVSRPVAAAHGLEWEPLDLGAD